MQKNKKPYLDFYGTHSISPVPNHGLSREFSLKRESLYRQLNLPLSIIKDRDVIEFGPGNGTNSLYTMSLAPKRYQLVDGNPTGVKNCIKNLNNHFPNEHWEISQSQIENFSSNEKFDLVICEGFIPNQLDPSKMAQHCTNFAKKNGIIILTCHDEISLISENIRAFLSTLITEPGSNFDDQVIQLSAFFKPDLMSLGVQTRSIDDWVIDNILNDEFWKAAPLFSMKDAIDSLGKKCRFLGSSPSFFTDWTWYKAVEDPHEHFNKKFNECYNANMHNLLDTRVLTPPNNEKSNLKLKAICSSIRELIKNSDHNDSTKNKKVSVQNFLKLSRSLENSLGVNQTETKVSLKSLNGSLSKYLKGGSLQSGDLNAFRKWWGRGMQYISMEKTAD
jgi:hypothetical protein